MGGMAEGVVVRLSGVRKRYGADEVLRGVDLAVRPGEFVSIRGKSGAGKTTLLKIIGLLERPDAGEVRLFGLRADGLSDGEAAEIRLRRIGFIFQFFNLIPTLTVLENVELPMALAGVGKAERRARAMELMRSLGIAGLADRMPGSLSGGERQRAAIARALANEPSLILADEPTSSLDDENSELVMAMLREASRALGASVIVTAVDIYERLPTDADYVLKEGVLRKA